MQALAQMLQCGRHGHSNVLDDPARMPAGVVADLARQLGIGNPDCIALYREGRARWRHAREIRIRLGYREFTDPFTRFRLARWLYALCWTGTDRPSVLFDRAMAWLVSEKLLLRGASALERLVARIRDRAARRLWRSLSRDITRAKREQLDGLLLAGDRGRPSPLDRLRDGPYLRSDAELARAIDRLDEVRLLTAGLPTGFALRAPCVGEPKRTMRWRSRSSMPPTLAFERPLRYLYSDRPPSGETECRRSDIGNASQSLC
jgi:hypothetical protein